MAGCRATPDGEEIVVNHQFGTLRRNSAGGVEQITGESLVGVVLGNIYVVILPYIADRIISFGDFLLFLLRDF